MFTLDQDIWILIFAAVSLNTGSHHSGVVGVYTLESECKRVAALVKQSRQPVPLHDMRTRCRHYVIKVPEIGHEPAAK